MYYRYSTQYSVLVLYVYSELSTCTSTAYRVGRLAVPTVQVQVLVLQYKYTEYDVPYRNAYGTGTDRLIWFGSILLNRIYITGRLELC